MQKTPFGRIPDNWGLDTIENACSIVTDYVANGSFKSLADNVKYQKQEDTTVLIRLVDYNNDFEGDFVYVNDHAYEFLAKSKLFGNEIIISNVGANVGTVFRCPNLDKQMTLGPNSVVLKFKDNDDFYFYWLKSPAGQHMLQSIVTGSAQPKFNKTNLRQIVIPVPSKEDQRKIAEILKLLDEKINVNKKIIRNLSEQATIIFEKELLMFDSVPVGWTESNLNEIADYLNGLAMQKYRPVEGENGIPVLKIKELRRGSCDSSSELCSSNIKPEYKVNDGDVIFSWSGSLLVDFWCGGECGLNQHLFKVTSNKYEKWFYYAWTLYHLDRFIAVANDKATTMGHIKREDLSKAEVLVPSKLDYDRIGAYLKPIYDRIIHNRIENFKLENLRNEILPKLMSGDLDVCNLEI